MLKRSCSGLLLRHDGQHVQGGDGPRGGPAAPALGGLPAAWSQARKPRAAVGRVVLPALCAARLRGPAGQQVAQVLVVRLGMLLLQVMRMLLLLVEVVQRLQVLLGMLVLRMLLRLQVVERRHVVMLLGLGLVGVEETAEALQAAEAMGQGCQAVQAQAQARRQAVVHQLLVRRQAEGVRQRPVGPLQPRAGWGQACVQPLRGLCGWAGAV